MFASKSGNKEEREQLARLGSKSSSHHRSEQPSRKNRASTHVGSLPDSVSEALAIEDPTSRSEQLARLAADVADQDLESALQAAPKLWDSTYGTLLINRWAALDPQSAADWAISLPADDGRQVLLGHVAQTWADQDLQAALKWIQNLSDLKERNLVTIEALKSGANAHPEQALQATLNLPVSPEREALLTTCIDQWAQRSPKEAADWAEATPDLDQRHQALTSVIYAWARTDPAAAADLAIAEINDANALQKAVVAVVAQGRIKDSQQIRSWIDEFPDGPIRTAAEAEWNRGHRISSPPPASLPGEDIEDRTSH